MFGERLAILRKSKGLSQYDLAERLGFSRGKLANYEQGSRQPDYDTLIKIADFFEVSTDYLLKGEDFRTQAEKLLNDPDTQIAARDGDMSKEKAMDALAWLLEQEKGRKPGDKQNRKK
ncbi:helix-turn-helix domain-containing protein [Metabacillus idriensis]|uniref:helix-turn-helix domain-containing protein n=1 Tax=Metabacillus idriensis TaxID=324768 RepID=UPI00203BAED3|nr:helix-turn-helix transcriptional regulator [Metabacillus idriensis]MCM3598661.1 helix-turn-helix domain-containing protein [Metabacillus idriensis]